MDTRIQYILLWFTFIFWFLNLIILYRSASLNIYILIITFKSQTFQIILNKLVLFYLSNASIWVWNKYTFLFGNLFFELNKFIFNTLLFNSPKRYKTLRISKFEWLILFFINAGHYWIAHGILVINNLNAFIFLGRGNITRRLLVPTFNIFSKLFLELSFIGTEIIHHMYLIIINCLSLWFICFPKCTCYIVMASTELAS